MPTQWTKQNVRHGSVARCYWAAMHGYRLNRSKGIGKSNYYNCNYYNDNYYNDNYYNYNYYNCCYYNYCYKNYCNCWPCTV